MDVRAAVAVAPGQPLTVETKQLEGSRAGNVNLMR
jgi:Zn-dependent alcohol dehydrogenase